MFWNIGPPACCHFSHSVSLDCPFLTSATRLIKEMMAINKPNPVLTYLAVFSAVSMFIIIVNSLRVD
jgi:hypothetical protein